MVKLNNIVKIYNSKKANEFKALHGVSAEIRDGELIAIIGKSGAGKSTLLHILACIDNYQEGEYYIDDVLVKDLSESQYAKIRNEKIGMVMQDFALVEDFTALENVMIPLNFSKKKVSDKKEKALAALKSVGIEELAKKLCSKLSGGQKQRVAIARALANNPDILLCDEATSALDPQTTQSILELLQQINHDYGITIVLITHEMSVVQKICNKVAILEKGHLVETGSVSKIFANPESAAAKKMIFGEDTSVPKMEGKHLVRIVFSENSSFEPVIGNMILRYKTPVNILHADTKDINGIATGEMILQLPEDEDIAKQMITYLRDCKLTVKEVEADVSL